MPSCLVSSSTRTPPGGSPCRSGPRADPWGCCSSKVTAPGPSADRTAGSSSRSRPRSARSSATWRSPKPGPGRGKLLSGLPGVAPTRVVILGSGTVSSNACGVAVGLGAQSNPKLVPLKNLGISINS
ncbi:MAG: hypothetical protein K6T35_08025 [Meiothermus silvanus]|nr:hypothetical protein [Allomeiothermus silvanus]